jgi:ribosomal protein S27E
MPFVMFGRKGKVRRVPDGQFEKRRCPECEKTTVFRECLVEKTYTAYHFVNLWTSESTQFACDACGSVMNLDETLDPELSAREKAQLAELERKEQLIAAKQAKAEQLRHERESVDREAALDDELAAMKARLGLDD